jgi:STE24 endopeptidase
MRPPWIGSYEGLLASAVVMGIVRANGESIVEIYLFIIVTLVVLDYLLGVSSDWLNVRSMATTVDEEFKGWYDEDKYSKAQSYLRESTRLDLVTSTFMVLITLAMILLGGFRILDSWVRTMGWGMVPTGLLFGGVLLVGSQVLQLPFSWYSTFVLEERYGFNRTTIATFIQDRIKGLLLTMVLGGALFAGVLWFFASAGSSAWLYAWLMVTVVQLVLIYVAPVVILPLFNKFTPLEEGSLKQRLLNYAQKEGFLLKGIFTMDGSRRSTRSNAYFTGFGRWRRIVLFDTLIEKHSEDELVSVLAHEVGHYKRKHITKHLVVSLVETGFMFYVLSLFLTQAGLYEAFGVKMAPVGGQPPLYAGMVFFGFLYAPIQMVLSVVGNIISRRHEYEADAFAVETVGTPEAMISALKRLSVDNLSNLSPHPFKVFMEYSHPPVLFRIAAIRKIKPA